MVSCGTCGQDGLEVGRACPRCGAMPVPDLDLGMRAPASARQPKAQRAPVEDVAIELAVDPRAAFPAPPSPAILERLPTAPLGPPHAPLPAPPRRPVSVAPAAGDLEGDARLLADYGKPPSAWILAPLYAWKVLRRQREVRVALAVRAAEAEHAAEALDDALVAFAERVRPAAEAHAEYRGAVDALVRAEETLRSRDRVLASEQDAQRARLGQVDARIGKLEAEIAEAQGRERAVATELSAAQGAVARAEAKTKRAETELRSAQREGGTAG